MEATLRQAIFANAINYYIFRIAKDDANLIVHNFEMKIPLSDTLEQKVKTLTGLQNRECIVRISANNELIPAFRATTLDFTPSPRLRQDSQKAKTYATKNPAKNKNEESVSRYQLRLDSSINLKELLQVNADRIELTHETSAEFIKHGLAKSNPEIHYAKSRSDKKILRKENPNE